MPPLPPVGRRLAAAVWSPAGLGAMLREIGLFKFNLY